MRLGIWDGGVIGITTSDEQLYFGLDFFKKKNNFGLERTSVCSTVNIGRVQDAAVFEVRTEIGLDHSGIGGGLVAFAGPCVWIKRGGLGQEDVWPAQLAPPTPVVVVIHGRPMKRL